MAFYVILVRNCVTPYTLFMQAHVRIGLALSYSFSFYRGVARGIHEYAETRPGWLFSMIAPDKRSLRWRADHIDGLLAGISAAATNRACSRWRCPVVNVSSVLWGLRFPRVGVDNRAVGELAAAHFLDLGLRHFAFVGHPGWYFSVTRQEAFQHALQQAGFESIEYHSQADKQFDSLANQPLLTLRVIPWLKRLPKPVGIFTPNDLWGLQLTELCGQAKVRIPDEVAILGVDDDDLLCEVARPQLSSVRLPSRQIGMEAAALLERLLSGKKAPKEPILLAPLGVTNRKSTDVLAINDEDVVAAARFIRNHAHEPIRVSDVLNNVLISRRSLERRFQMAFGRGISEEIQRGHIERAKRLLSETDLPIYKVATQAGFTDFRHLATVFRQRFAQSPLAYRRSVRTIH